MQTFSLQIRQEVSLCWRSGQSALTGGGFLKQNTSSDMDMYCLFRTAIPMTLFELYVTPLRSSFPFWFSGACRHRELTQSVGRSNGSAIPVGIFREHIIITTENSPAVQPVGNTDMLLKTGATFFQSIHSVTHLICSLTHPSFGILGISV